MYIPRYNPDSQLSQMQEVRRTFRWCGNGNQNATKSMTVCWHGPMTMFMMTMSLLLGLCIFHAG